MPITLEHTSSCEPLTVMATPTITTALSGTTIYVGSSVYDTATLTGATGKASGTVQYRYFNSGTCSGHANYVGSAVTVTNGVVPNSVPQDVQHHGFLWLGGGLQRRCQ